MIHKEYVISQVGLTVQVTFTIPNCIWADKIELAIANSEGIIYEPLGVSPTGDWTLTLDLPVDQVYRFHYLCDEKQWMDDTSADGFERNPIDGSNICILNTSIASAPNQAPSPAHTPVVLPVVSPVMPAGGRR